MDFSRFPRLNFPLCLYLVVCIFTLTTVTYLYRQFHSIEIVINENGKIDEVSSKADDVEGFLKEQEIALGPYDRVCPGLEEPLEKGMEIEIKRAFPVIITTEAGSFKHYSHATVVSEALKELGISLSGCHIEPETSASVFAGKEIFVFRQVFSIDTHRETIAYPIEKRMDDTVYKGRTKLIQEGKEGIKELKYRVVYAGEKELFRECIGEKVIAEPIPSVVAIGIKPLPTAPVIMASRGERVEGIASWYGPGFHGKKTASNEIFDQYANTAAHRSLPFNSYLKVTFIKTGKSVVVRINDRGPNDTSRIIDLSRGAADRIGLRPYGIGRVRVEVVEVKK